MKRFSQARLDPLGILLLTFLVAFAAEASSPAAVEPSPFRVEGLVHGLSSGDVVKVFIARYSEDGHHSDTRSTLVLPDGSFSFDDLESGEWIAAARIRGSGRRATTRFSITPGAETMRSVSPLVLRFAPSSDRTLTGTLKINGEPAADARVSWIELSVASLPVDDSTDSRGRFHLRGLPLGPQLLEIKGPWGTYRQTVDYDGTEGDVDLDIETRRISGRVVDAEGRPVAGARLAWIYPQPGARAFSELENRRGAAARPTDESGRFELPHVMTGAVDLMVRHDALGFLLRKLDLQTNLDDLTLDFKPAHRVRFDLRQPDGSMPTATSLLILQDQGTPLQMGALETESEEHALFLPEGRWRVLLLTDSTRARPFWVEVPGGPYAPEMRPKTILDLRVPELEHTDQARVLLLDSRGEPHSARDLGLESDGYPLTGGRLIVNLPQDTWTLSVNAPDGRRLQRTVETDPSEWTKVEMR